MFAGTGTEPKLQYKRLNRNPKTDVNRNRNWNRNWNLYIFIYTYLLNEWLTFFSEYTFNFLYIENMIGSKSIKFRNEIKNNHLIKEI